MKTFPKTILVSISALLAAGSLGGGCVVDQEPSMSLNGSVQYAGSVEDDGTVTCEVSANAESVEYVSSRGQIDIWELEHYGQPGPEGAFSSFVFNAAIENLLDESTQVGSGGGGGGGSDNFGGLKKDQNSIMVTGATVRYPADLNDYPGAEFASKLLEKKELFSAVLDSGGGNVLIDFPIVSAREIGKLKNFYKQALEAAAQSGSSAVDPDSEDAIVPIVAELQIEGETFGGEEVESNKFQFPLDICLDCTPAVNKDANPDNDVVDKFQTTSTCFVSEE